MIASRCGSNSYQLSSLLLRRSVTVKGKDTLCSCSVKVPVTPNFSWHQNPEALVIIMWLVLTPCFRVSLPKSLHYYYTVTTVTHQFVLMQTQLHFVLHLQLHLHLPKVTKKNTLKSTYFSTSYVWGMQCSGASTSTVAVRRYSSSR